MITVVIARTDETLDWLHDLPAHCHVQVHDCGESLAASDLPEGTGLSRMRAGSGVTDCLLQHLQDLQQRQQAGLPLTDASGWTMFAPGNAPEHAPALFDLLARPQHWADVQPLATRGARALPRRLAEQDQRDWVGGLPVRAERYCLATLVPLGRPDPDASRLADRYAHRHGLESGSNLIAHFLDLCGLPALADAAERSDLGVCAAGNVLAVRNHRLHSLARQATAALHRMEALLRSDANYRPLLDRCWLHLLGLPFVQLAGLPAPMVADTPAAVSLARAVASIDALLARNPTRTQVSAAARVGRGGGTGLRLGALDDRDGRDGPDRLDPQQAPLPQAWIPDLNRIGQIGARLREHSLG